MKGLLVLWLGFGLLGGVAAFPRSTQAQTRVLQDGFYKDAKGVLVYREVRTNRSYPLAQPGTALKTLRSLARTVAVADWERLKKTPGSLSSSASPLFVVKGSPNRVWYLAPTEQRYNYFDGTRASFVILQRESLNSAIPEEVPAREPAVTAPMISKTPSFSYRKQKTDHVIVMDVTKGLRMSVVTGHDAIRPTEECRYPKYCKAETRAEAFSSYLKRLSSATLVMNGGYFDAYSKPLDENNFHTVSSDLIIDGKMASMYGWDKAWGDGGMIAQKKDGSFAFYYPIRNWVPDADLIQSAVSNYPLVLLNGVPRVRAEMPVSDPNDYKFWLSARRGGLGLSADGTKVVYVSITGTVEDLGRALLGAGAVNGFALDAGGSNGLAFQGKAIFTPGRKLASVIAFQ